MSDPNVCPDCGQRLPTELGKWGPTYWDHLENCPAMPHPKRFGHPTRMEAPNYVRLWG